MSKATSKKITIDRLEALEKKHGIELNLNALEVKDEYSTNYSAHIFAEVIGDLEYDIKFICNIYNLKGELIGVEQSTSISKENFDGIDNFAVELDAPVGERIAKVRVYPQKY